MKTLSKLRLSLILLIAIGASSTGEESDLTERAIPVREAPRRDVYFYYLTPVERQADDQSPKKPLQHRLPYDYMWPFDPFVGGGFIFGIRPKTDGQVDRQRIMFITAIFGEEIPRIELRSKLTSNGRWRFNIVREKDDREGTRVRSGFLSIRDEQGRDWYMSLSDANKGNVPCLSLEKTHMLIEQCGHHSGR